MSSRYTPFLSDPFRSSTKKIRKVLGVDDVNGTPADPNADYSDLPTNNPYELSDLQLAPRKDLPINLNLDLQDKINGALLAQEETKVSTRSAPAVAKAVVRGQAPREGFNYSGPPLDLNLNPKGSMIPKVNLDINKPTPTIAKQIASQPKPKKLGAGDLQLMEAPGKRTKPLKFTQVEQKDKEEKGLGAQLYDQAKGLYKGLDSSLYGMLSSGKPLGGFSTFDIPANMARSQAEEALAPDKDYQDTFGNTLGTVGGGLVKIGALTPIVGPVAAAGAVGATDGIINEFKGQATRGQAPSVKDAAVAGVSEGLQNVAFAGVSKLGINKLVSNRILNKTGSNALTLLGNSVANAGENVLTSGPISLATDYAADQLTGTDRFSRNPYRDPSSPEFWKAVRNDVTFGAGLPFAMEAKNAVEAKRAGASIPEALGTIATGETPDNLVERQIIDSAIKKQQEIIKTVPTTPEEKAQAKDNIVYLKEQKTAIGNPDKQAKLENPEAYALKKKIEPLETKKQKITEQLSKLAGSNYDEQTKARLVPELNKVNQELRALYGEAITKRNSNRKPPEAPVEAPVEPIAPKPIEPLDTRVASPFPRPVEDIQFSDNTGDELLRGIYPLGKNQSKVKERYDTLDATFPRGELVDVTQDISPEVRARQEGRILDTKNETVNDTGKPDNSDPQLAVPRKTGLKFIAKIFNNPQVKAELRELGFSPTMDKLTPETVAKLANISPEQGAALLNQLSTPSVDKKGNPIVPPYKRNEDGSYSYSSLVNKDFIKARLEANRQVKDIAQDIEKQFKAGKLKDVSDTPYDFPNEAAIKRNYEQYTKKEQRLIERIKNLSKNPKRVKELEATRKQLMDLEVNQGRYKVLYKAMFDETMKEYPLDTLTDDDAAARQRAEIIKMNNEARRRARQANQDGTQATQDDGTMDNSLPSIGDSAIESITPNNLDNSVNPTLRYDSDKSIIEGLDSSATQEIKNDSTQPITGQGLTDQITGSEDGTRPPNDSGTIREDGASGSAMEKGNESEVPRPPDGGGRGLEPEPPTGNNPPEAKQKKAVDPEAEAKRIAASKAAKEAKKKQKEDAVKIQDKKFLEQAATKLKDKLSPNNPTADLIDILSDDGVLRNDDSDNIEDVKVTDENAEQQQAQLEKERIYGKYEELPLRYQSQYGPLISKLSLKEYLGSLNAARAAEGLPRLTEQEITAETNHYNDTVNAYKATDEYLKEVEKEKADLIAATKRASEEVDKVIKGEDNKNLSDDLVDIEDKIGKALYEKPSRLSGIMEKKDIRLEAAELTAKLPSEITYGKQNKNTGKSDIDIELNPQQADGKIGYGLNKYVQTLKKAQKDKAKYLEETYQDLVKKAEDIDNRKYTKYLEMFENFTEPEYVPLLTSTKRLRNFNLALIAEAGTGSPKKRAAALILQKKIEGLMESKRTNEVQIKATEAKAKPLEKAPEPVEQTVPTSNRSRLLDQAGIKLIPKVMDGRPVYKVIDNNKPTGPGKTRITYQDTTTGKWVDLEVPVASVKDKPKTDTREPLTGGSTESKGISMGLQGSMFGLTQQHVETALRVGKELVKGFGGEASTGKSKVVDELIKARKWLQDIFVAPTITKGSQDAANIFRKNNGLYEMESSRLEAIFDPILKHMDTLDDAAKNEFITNIEKGTPQGDPVLNEVAKLTTEALDSVRDFMKGENPDVLKKFYETYWPRMWSKESVETARKIAAQMDNSIEGTKNFLKKRSFQDYMDGINAGLKPVDPNPIRVMLLKLREMNRFIAGRRIWKEAATDGLIKRFDPLSKDVPEGWVKIEDPLGTEAYYKPQWGKYQQAKRNLRAENFEGLQKPDSKLKPAMARVETGYYYAPPEVARIFNIGAKQGIGDIPMSDAYKYVGRMSNMMRVAWSSWHFNNIAADSMATRLQLGLRNLREGTKSLLKGEFNQAGARAGQGLKAVKDVVYNTASAPATIYTYFKRGKQLQRYLKYSDITRADINNQQARNARGLDSIGARVQDLASQLKQKKGAWDKIGDMIWGDPSKMPASMKADMDAQLNMLAEAGGRIAPDPMYASDTFSNKFKKALKERRPIGMAANVIPAISEFVSKPLMHHYIPSVKIGAFLDLYQKRIEAMTPQEIANLDTADFGGKLWDQIEDRMGEVTYENYFFDKISKEAFHASVAFVGWRIGSTRQILGAGIDAARVPFKIIDRASKAIKPGGLDIVNKGIGPVGGLDRLDEIFPLDRDNNKQLVTDRLEYFMAAGLGLAAYNTLMMAAMGQTPEDWKDLFYRPTGRINPDGSKERLAPPTLAKDVYGVATQPVEYVKGGLRAEFAAFLGAYTNKDYQGFQINNPKDDISQRTLDTTGYILKQLFLPYSIANEQKRQKTTNPYSGEEDGILNSIYNVALGESLAPYYITRSSAQRLLGEYSRQQIPEGGISRDIKDKLDARRHIKEGLEVGDTTPLENAIRDNYLTPEQAKSLLDMYQDVPDTARLNRLDVDKALNVYELASAEERKKFAPVMIDKIEALESKTPEERNRILNRMKQLGIESHLNNDLYQHNYDVAKEKISTFTELEGNPNFRRLPKETQEFLKTKLAAVFNNFRFTKDKDLPNSVTQDALPYFQEAFKEFIGNKELKKELVDALIEAGPAAYEAELAKKEVLGNKSTAGFDYDQDGTYEDSQE